MLNPQPCTPALPQTPHAPRPYRHAVMASLSQPCDLTGSLKSGPHHSKKSGWSEPPDAASSIKPDLNLKIRCRKEQKRGAMLNLSGSMSVVNRKAECDHTGQGVLLRQVARAAGRCPVGRWTSQTGLEPGWREVNDPWPASARKPTCQLGPPWIRRPGRCLRQHWHVHWSAGCLAGRPAGYLPVAGSSEVSGLCKLQPVCSGQSRGR